MSQNFLRILQPTLFWAFNFAIIELNVYKEMSPFQLDLCWLVLIGSLIGIAALYFVPLNKKAPFEQVAVVSGDFDNDEAPEADSSPERTDQPAKAAEELEKLLPSWEIPWTERERFPDVSLPPRKPSPPKRSEKELWLELGIFFLHSLWIGTVFLLIRKLVLVISECCGG